MKKYKFNKKYTGLLIILFVIFSFMGLGYAALSTSLGITGNMEVSSAQYAITYSGSNATFSPTSSTIIYGSTTTAKITPATGYYLSRFSCTNGYTANATTGISATGAQTITISNNKNALASVCTATTSNAYTVTITGTGVTLGAASLGLTYGKTATIKVTPSTGYYLKSASCTNGYTITNATYGVGNTAAQTVTINNNSNTKNSACTFTASNSYTATMSGSNVTFGSTSVAVTYGGTKTVTLTPATGYYLSSLTCTNGYTTNATTGTSATGAQTITISNNSKTSNSTCTATMAKRSFTATMSGSNVTFGATSLSVAYGGTNTVKVTPATGYYLKSLTCTNGYTTNATTGTSATGTQTITIKNNNNANNSTCVAEIACLYSVGQSWSFFHNDSIQIFSVPIKGTYKLEVWGAQGTTNTYSEESMNYHFDGGLGGYSYGNIAANIGTNLYVVVGGQNGYNGGGAGPSYANYTGNGGGATHIAFATGILSSLENNKSSILIVAGGGGGGGAARDNASSAGGTGGGSSGGDGYGAGIQAAYGWGEVETGGGGSSTAGGYSQCTDIGPGKFGQGGTCDTGGGGGWYGGGAGGDEYDSDDDLDYIAGAGGGSGYIGGVSDGETKNGQRSGNGYAVITLVSIG